MAPIQTSASSRRPMARLPHRVTEQRWDQICASYRARTATPGTAAGTEGDR